MTDKKNEEDLEEVVDELIPGMKGVIQKLRSTSQELDDRLKEADAEIERRMAGRTDKPAPVVDYGIKVRTLSDVKRGSPVSSPRRKSPTRDPVIEPITDLFDEGDHLRIIAELPGVTEEGVSTSVDGLEVHINAEGSGRRYAARVTLPRPAEIELLRCNNGILEVVLR